MNNTEKISFRQSRDFGETFNISIKYLKQNYKSLFSSLLMISGPFVLLSAIAGAFYQSTAVNSFNVFASPTARLAQQFGLTYVLFILAAVVANLSIIATVFAHMIEYHEKGPEGITVNGVAKVVVKNIGAVVAVFFVMFLLIMLVLVVIVGIMIGIGAAVPALGILFGLALIVGMLILFPPFLWMLSAMYLVKMQEERGVMESYSRTKEVMRGNFWWTWLIVVCSSIAIGLIGFVFTLPQVIYQTMLMIGHMKGDGDTETSIPFLVVATVCTFCSTLLYSALYVINGFHYYSLAEQQDGTGLMDRINEIGNSSKSNVEQHY